MISVDTSGVARPSEMINEAARRLNDEFPKTVAAAGERIIASIASDRSRHGRPNAPAGALHQQNLEYVDETPRRPRRSAEQKSAEDALDHHWVSLIGWEKPLPGHFGDNRGVWPVHVEVNGDWRQSGVVFDRQQPHVRAARFDVIGVGSREGAYALKTALDEALAGRETETGADPLRHRSRDVAGFGDFLDWWGPVLLDAISRATGGGVTGIEMFSRAEHEAMVAARVQRDMIKRGRG